MSENLDHLKRNHLLDLLFAGRFGIEIEEHRVQLGQPRLSQHPHSRQLGTRKTNPYFQTDFSESQEELVTAPKHASKDALAHLHELQTILSNELSEDEIIWPLSMPPHLNEDDIDFLLTHFERPWYQEYREELIARYGYYQHIMTGVHVNYSPADNLIDWFGSQHHIQSYPAAKNRLYFQIAQQVTGYRWLLTYLFGASPVTENSADNLPNNRLDIQPVRSWRASDFGFANRPEILVDYSDFETHIRQIRQYIANGDFYDKSEFYGPVRLKGPGEIEDLIQNGANYMEFRMFDTDPFSLDGISQTALSFLHLLIIDAIVNPQPWPKHTAEGARAFNHVVALAHPDEPLSSTATQHTHNLLTRLAEIVAVSPADLRDDFNQALDYAKTALDDPKQTIGAHLASFIKNDSLTTYAVTRGQAILKTRQQAKDNFVFVPKNLQKNYIQAHKLGFKTLMREDNHLQVTYGDKVWAFMSDEDLTQYLPNHVEK